MDKQNKIQQIKSMLIDVYDGRLSDSELNEYSAGIYRTFFEECAELEYIMSTVFEYEYDYEISDDDSQVSYVYDGIVNLLENNQNTARRLYNEFMFRYHNLDVVFKILNENSEWLSDEEIKAVKRNAWSIFDKDMLKSIGCDWENI